MLTEQQKKYLITIYLLGQNGERVRTTDIADYLHVAKASAVKMCRTSLLQRSGSSRKKQARQA